MTQGQGSAKNRRSALEANKKELRPTEINFGPRIGIDPEPKYSQIVIPSEAIDSVLIEHHAGAPIEFGLYRPIVYPQIGGFTITIKGKHRGDPIRYGVSPEPFDFQMKLKEDEEDEYTILNWLDIAQAKKDLENYAKQYEDQWLGDYAFTTEEAQVVND